MSFNPRRHYSPWRTTTVRIRQLFECQSTRANLTIVGALLDDIHELAVSVVWGENVVESVQRMREIAVLALVI